MPRRRSLLQRKMSQKIRKELDLSWGGSVTKAKWTAIRYKKAYGTNFQSALSALRMGYSVMELINVGFPKEVVKEAFETKRYLDKVYRIRGKKH